jgi:hypothetical protein
MNQHIARSRPKLLSSVEGTIREVLIVFPGIATAASEWEYAAIIETFNPKGTVHKFKQEAPEWNIKVVRSSFRSARGDGVPSPLGAFRDVNDVTANINLFEMLRRWQGELEALSNGDRLCYRRWAQDPFVTLAWDDAVILLQSYYTHCLADHLLPFQLAEQGGPNLLLKPTRLYLEGGNILCANGIAYVGRDLIQQNEDLHGGCTAGTITQLREVLGVDQVIPIGTAQQHPRFAATEGESATTWQPLFHIDLFLTFGGMDSTTGRQWVFVANARLANELLEREQMQVATEKARLQTAGVVPEGSGETGRRIRLSETEIVNVRGLEEIRDSFPEVEYAVVELPIYFFLKACYSWNNCLVEVDAGGKRVYLPTYITESDHEKLNPTFEVLEGEVHRRFREAGFEVIPIPSGRFFRILARNGGSLHCAVKILRRDPLG